MKYKLSNPLPSSYPSQHLGCHLGFLSFLNVSWNLFHWFLPPLSTPYPSWILVTASALISLLPALPLTKACVTLHWRGLHRYNRTVFPRTSCHLLDYMLFRNKNSVFNIIKSLISGTYCTLGQYVFNEWMSRWWDRWLGKSYTCGSKIINDDQHTEEELL